MSSKLATDWNAHVSLGGFKVLETPDRASPLTPPPTKLAKSPNNRSLLPIAESIKSGSEASSVTGGSKCLNLPATARKMDSLGSQDDSGGSMGSSGFLTPPSAAHPKDLEATKAKMPPTAGQSRHNASAQPKSREDPAHRPTWEWLRSMPKSYLPEAHSQGY
jgi:hypothetical protein